MSEGKKQGHLPHGINKDEVHVIYLSFFLLLLEFASPKQVQGVKWAYPNCFLEREISIRKRLEKKKAAKERKKEKRISYRKKERYGGGDDDDHY